MTYSSHNNRFSSKPRFQGHPARRFSRRSAAPKGFDLSKLINKATPIEEREFIPEHTFAEFALNETLKKNVAAKGYIKPTPIQDKAIIPVLEGKDVVGIANTGTGKTAAFLLPLITKVAADRTQHVLILAPTRELAQQIFNEFFIFSKGMALYSVLCVGGLHMGAQIRGLKGKPHFVIATPGRLKDLAKRKMVDLKTFNTIVLDEADRMVDMGFIHDIKFLLSLLPAAPRHSLFFSATISPAVHTLIQQFLHNPVTVSVKSRDTSSNIDQDVIRVSDHTKKIDMLKTLLAQAEFNKVLIFGRTKHGVEKLSHTLAEKGFKVASIHSNKSQSSRQKALQLFKQNVIKVLVATDVAARGLDINGVSHVINYDMPATYDDYIHRIGRTGRADKIGKALTFIDSTH